MKAPSGVAARLRPSWDEQIYHNTKAGFKNPYRPTQIHGVSFFKNT